MTLLEILIKGVGSGVAKGILNIWLEEYPFAKEIGKNITSILASKTNQVLAQRKGRRQFEEISERVAENLKLLFDEINDPISVTRKKEVAELAGQAIHNLQIDADLLLSFKLDHHLIEEALLKESYYPNNESPFINFTSAQKKLYRLVISEAAQYMVDIAAQLPSFTERTIHKVLTDNAQILERADQILAEFLRMRDEERIGDSFYKKFGSDYRKAVVRVLDELQLFGVDLAASSKRYRLTVAYVSLSVSYSQNYDPDFSKQKLISVEEALAQNDRILIRGPAGSGKTTLMHWIAVMAASSTMKGKLEPWNRAFPFFVRLREFSDKKLPEPQDFLSLISPALSGAMPSTTWVHQQFEAGKAILLVDGLDELIKKKREDVRKWLEDLVGAYPKAKYVLTTRPYAAEENWLSRFVFQEAYLYNMNVQAVYEFIDHWHEAVKESVAEQSEKGKIDLLGKKLKLVIDKNRSIRKLATNPLLCALICALHRDRESEIPGDRSELYRICIEMFFRRDLERKVDLEEHVKFGNKSKISLLSDFAYWMIKNGLSEVSVKKTDEKFDKIKLGLSDIPTKTNGEDLRTYFVERSGILRQPNRYKVDFPHRTFQEYLAAKAAVNDNEFGLLYQHAKDVQWREVIILACSQARPDESEEMILNILDQSNKSKKFRASLRLLAAACADLTNKLPSDVKDKVQKSLGTLVPPRNMKEATELATAEELILPYLKYNTDYSVDELVASIKTILLVGGENAIGLLNAYSKDERIEVVKAIIDGRKDVPTPDKYLKSFVFKIKRVYKSDNIPLAALYQMPALIHLILSNTSVPRINFLAQMKNLAKLSLKHNSYTKKDLSSMKDLKSLKEINFFSTHLEGIEVFKHLKNLETLNLASTNIVDISALENLKKLKHLDLRYTKVKNIKPLENLKNLSYLDLSHTPISDFSALKNLRNLKVLNLSNARIYNEDLENLQDLTKLERLNLWGTSVSNLSPLSKIKNLDTLIISHTNTRSIRSLFKLKNLKHLHLRNTQIPTNQLDELWLEYPWLSIHDGANKKYYRFW